MSEEIFDLLDELLRQTDVETATSSDTGVTEGPVETSNFEGDSEYGYEDYGYDIPSEGSDSPAESEFEQPENYDGADTPIAEDDTMGVQTPMTTGPDSSAMAGWEYDSATALYTDPASGYVYDSNTGIFYDPITGDGFDTTSGMLYTPTTGWYGGWDTNSLAVDTYWNDPLQTGMDDPFGSGYLTGSVSSYPYESGTWDLWDTTLYPNYTNYGYGYETPYYNNYASGSGAATAGWDIYGHYGNSWYGGTPIEYDYSDFYPDTFGPGSMTPNDPTLFPDSDETSSPYTATF